MLPEDEWHMTLVTKDELRGLSTTAVQEAIESLSTRCFTIGLGGGNGATRALVPTGVYFVVFVWPKAQAFRTKYGLPLKDFHVSVSTSNRHDIDKTCDALLDNSCLESLDKSTLEVLSRQVTLEHKLERAMEIATLLCTKFGEETMRGWMKDATRHCGDIAVLNSKNVRDGRNGVQYLSLEKQSNSGVPVLVHCGGGKGRAGTMVACYLVAFGFKPPPVELDDGSGKSSLSRALAKRTTASRAAPFVVRSCNALYQPWTEITSDEIGRKGCERSIGQGGIRRAILDRCNGIAADRKKFLSLAATWSQHATVVVFDMPSKLCEARAMQRVDHPTLPPGRRVGFAIRQHSSTFEFPELDEGFQTLVHITSVEAALELVDLLSPPLPLLKFPRTPHLLDLGAATSDDLVSDFSNIALVVDSDTTVVITEKVDGANMGISLSPEGALIVQNRSHVINSESHRQF
ncbi:uncharacterized protein PITG_08918 [Phytophthora infestans T30-4]|uniref:Tyrosine specific protein phosphatases domain-containing protein n=1 Tax=Phytophthora infestans (strain T30-4) TaxID=403677 RepID=D0NDH6_PHYIT|nr:uncharacterized protein PITG_08918 [Phytophthora infestans T30-4]EEY56133.1 conserved hypothetical protein [Phytophthora infestans T30-4]|eukprot:XP_002902963.1 conserved hypothetical protein [Phytophthora infestans T30-4]